MYALRRIVTGKWKENCYVLHSSDRRALIIDPGEDYVAIREALEEGELIPLAVINTHAHFDHVGAVAPIVEEYHVPFYLHAGDFKLLRTANLYTHVFEGLRPVKIPKVDFDLSKFESLSLGDFHVQILETPGHTMGSVSFLIAGNLFTGDTLLPGEFGRTDLPGGNQAELTQSLKRLLSLPGETTVYGGHGDSFKIRDILDDKELMERLG